jgi:hypothetical protein
MGLQKGTMNTNPEGFFVIPGSASTIQQMPDCSISKRNQFIRKGIRKENINETEGALYFFPALPEQSAVVLLVLYSRRGGVDFFDGMDATESVHHFLFLRIFHASDGKLAANCSQLLRGDQIPRHSHDPDGFSLVIFQNVVPGYGAEVNSSRGFWGCWESFVSSSIIWCY